MKRLVSCLAAFAALLCGCQANAAPQMHPDICGVLSYLQLDGCQLTELAPYTGLTVTQAQPQVSEAELDEKLASLQLEEEQIVPLARTQVRSGDLVNYTWRVSCGGATLQEAKTTHMKLGAGTFDPAIEAGLDGCVTGKDYTFARQLPQDESQYGHLAGAQASVHVVINYIYEVHYPEISDAWARERFGCADLAAPREQLREELLEQKRQQAAKELRQQLLQRVADASAFSYDEQQCIAYGRQLAVSSLSAVFGFGYTAETYDAYIVDRYGSEEAFYAQCYELALQNARYFLTIGAIAASEGLTVTQAELAAELQALGIEEKSATEEALCYARYYVLEEEVLDILAQNAA